MMETRWQIIEPDRAVADAIRRRLGCDPVTAGLLANRKIADPEAAGRFIRPTLGDLRPPFGLRDTEHAVERIATAITSEEKILIFGDYDADGVTATAVLWKFLSYAGADVDYYIPHRIDEGYGLSENHIPDVAIPGKFDLIITVDCGIGSIAAVEAARNAGIDVIVTDHHNAPDRLPKAFAVIDPKRDDCESGLDDLAGVGVAFYLLICLRKHLRDNNFWRTLPEPNLKSYCDLVALGTVADMVPLVDENRILSRIGLDLINSGARTGVDALVKTSGIKNQNADSEDIAFKLAPRLNAAGRMAHAKMAAELLMTEDRNIALRIAGELSQLNKKRRDEEKRIVEDILDMLKTEPHLLRPNAIVLADENWNVGILGIVASKIVNRYYRPVVLISIQDGIGKGSARSIPGIDLYKGLASCSDLLENFGGHRMAAGLKVKPESVSRFAAELDTAIAKMTTPDVFSPIVTIDCELDFRDISGKLLNELELLKPYGEGNPEPLFMARDVAVVSSKIVGKNHRRMTLVQPGKSTRPFPAIHFGIDVYTQLEQRFDKMTYRIRWNHYNGLKTPQIVVENIK